MLSQLPQNEIPQPTVEQLPTKIPPSTAAASRVLAWLRIGRTNSERMSSVSILHSKRMSSVPILHS